MFGFYERCGYCDRIVVILLLLVGMEFLLFSIVLCMSVSYGFLGVLNVCWKLSVIGVLF